MNPFANRVPVGSSLAVDGALFVPLHDDGEEPTFIVEVVNGLPFPHISPTLTLGPLVAVDPAQGRQLEIDYRNRLVQQGVLLEGPINTIANVPIYRLTVWMNCKPTTIKTKGTRVLEIDPPTQDRGMVR